MQSSAAPGLPLAEFPNSLPMPISKGPTGMPCVDQDTGWHHVEKRNVVALLANLILSVFLVDSTSNSKQLNPVSTCCQHLVLCLVGVKRSKAMGTVVQTKL